MPPKSKKEQEEEAAKLAQEQKQREEEEAKLALERQKYAAQTLPTGLLLPASCQLVIDLQTQPLSFITGKIQQALLESCPKLNEDCSFKQLVLKELVHSLVEGTKIFGVKILQVSGHQEQLLKVRVLAGIVFKLMTHEHKALGGEGKSRSGDERLMKEQMGLHVQKGQGKMRIYTPKEAEVVLTCISSSYFSHYLLLQNYRGFSKRQSQTQQLIYISAPAVCANNKETPFQDLSEPVKQEQAPANLVSE